jgi:4a-hydroxytetrahydrobiopterin dehydratase
MDLLSKKCAPCGGDIKPFDEEKIASYLLEVPGWSVKDYMMISRHFEFHDFVEAMDFVNKVARVAEAEGHHPDIHIFYSKVDIDLWTHAIHGLSENDFIVAAKINQISF